MINVERVVSSVERALPEAEPFAAIPMLLRQLEYLESPRGLGLMERLIENVHPENLEFSDDFLDQIPQSVADRAMGHIRSLPKGKHRIYAFCNVAEHLTLEEKREALDGILDGTLPSTNYNGAKPVSYRGLFEGFCRTLPESWQEEWLSTHSGIEEISSRNNVGRLDESTVRRMWSRIRHRVPKGEIPVDYLRISEFLPGELKAKALAVIRRGNAKSGRLLYLHYFDEELTDAEREEVVTTPWNEYTRDNPSSQADHLESVVRHFPKVPYDLCRNWLNKVLEFSEDYDKQRGLMALLDQLKGEDRERGIGALVESVLKEGRFYTLRTEWNLLPDEEFKPLLRRVRTDPYGWSRYQIISHLTTERGPGLADKAFLSLLDGLDELPSEHCLEIVDALTPWLADRTHGEMPKRIAELPVPNSATPADPLYKIARAIDQEEIEEGDEP